MVPGAYVTRRGGDHRIQVGIMNLSLIRAATAALLSLNAPTGPGLQAQEMPSRQEPAVVALVEQLPTLRQQYPAVILRRAGVTPQDVILLPRATASAELLDAATRVLLHMRASAGQRQTTHQGKPFGIITIGVRHSTAPAEWATQELPRAEQLLEQLRRARAQHVPRVGTFPAVEFTPPAPLRR